MFDALNLEQTMIDINSVGLRGQYFSSVYNVNKEVKLAIKTPAGLTERQDLESTVLQGDTVGSILASVQADNIMRDTLLKNPIIIQAIMQRKKIAWALCLYDNGILSQCHNCYIPK